MATAFFRVVLNRRTYGKARFPLLRKSILFKD